MDFLREHKRGVFIFLLALTARLLFLGVSLQAHDGNMLKTIWAADDYYEVSSNVIAGHGYSIDQAPPYTPYAYRPPVYHYFIVGSYFLLGGFWGVILLQILLGSLVPLLAMRISQFIIESKKLAIGVGVLLALEPYSILFSTILYTETFFTFLFLLSLWCLFAYFKSKKAYLLFLSAFILGLTVLIKPVVQYLPILFILSIVWEARGNISKEVLMRAAGYALFFLLAISPWLYRNYVNFDVVGISPQKGTALYFVLVPSVLSLEHTTSFNQEFQNLTKDFGAGFDLNKLTFANSDAYEKLGVTILKSHLGALSLLSANTGLNFFIHDGMLDVLRHINASPKDRLGGPALFMLFSAPGELFGFIKKVFMTPAVLILFGRLLWVGITVAFFAGAVRYLRKEKITPYGILALSLVFYFMLTTLVVGLAISARYRMPVNIFILLFALYGLIPLYRNKVTQSVAQRLKYFYDPQR